jgi:hypothetical protein
LLGLRNGTLSEKKAVFQEKFNHVMQPYYTCECDLTPLVGTVIVNSWWLCHQSSGFQGNG